MNHSVIPSGPHSDAVARNTLKREMESLCRRIGIPTWMAGVYHIIESKGKNGTIYTATWGVVGYYYVLHMDPRGSPSIINEMVRWSKENEGRAVARCTAQYRNGDIYAAFGHAHIDQFEGRERHTFHHTDAMAETRATERCARAATANGLTLLGYDRPLDAPVVVEVKENG